MNPPRVTLSAISPIVLLLLWPTVLACRPVGPAVDDPAEVKELCASVDGQKYCFDRSLVYVRSDDGFLLELPLNELDHSCNRDRVLYPFVHVLFSSGHPPPAENYKLRPPLQELRILKREEFFFENSDWEMEFCESAPGRGIVHCQHISDWGPGRVEFGYDEQCASQARDYARELKKFLEKGAR
jgi:hypothetical protein